MAAIDHRFGGGGFYPAHCDIGHRRGGSARCVQKAEGAEVAGHGGGRRASAAGRADGRRLRRCAGGQWTSARGRPLGDVRGAEAIGDLIEEVVAAVFDGFDDGLVGVLIALGFANPAARLIRGIGSLAVEFALVGDALCQRDRAFAQTAQRRDQLENGTGGVLG